MSKEKHVKSENLLIIGNGFDLYCGLKSTFVNFFAYLIQEQIKEMGHKSFNTFNSSINEYVGKQCIKKYNISNMHLNSKDSNFVKGLIGLFSRYNYNLYPTNNYITLSKLNAHFDSSYFIYLLLKLWGHDADGELDVDKDSKFIGLYKCFNIIYEYPSNNFWIMYFEMLFSIDHFDKYMYFNNNWSDIEHNLMIFMTKYSENICKYVNNLISLYKENNDLSRTRNNLFETNIHDIYRYNINNSKKVKDITFNSSKLMKFFIINMSVVLLIKAGFFKKNVTRQNLQYKFYKFLYQQLMIFENKFSKYMYQMMHKKVNKWHGKGKEMIKTRYLHMVPKLINLLIPGVNTSLNLLSFNYVKLNLDKYNSKKGHNNKIQGYKSIHSVLTKYNGHPIIGISADRCKDKNGIKPYIIFSKSFRIMKLSSTLRNIRVLPDKNNIKNIIFFGHSLDPSDDADYPYFQSIFDKYDIYNSKVRLIFCYGVFDSKHYNMDGKNDKCSKKYYKSLKDKQAVSMFHKVSTLLSKYELTLNNKDLWSKLLIEDRLILHCVNDSYKYKTSN